jgi:hypothetical protein
MLTSLDAVGVDPIHIYDLATSKVAADNNIAPSLAWRTLTPPLRPRNDGTPQSVGQARRSSNERGPRNRSLPMWLQLGGRHAQVVAE